MNAIIPIVFEAIALNGIYFSLMHIKLPTECNDHPSQIALNVLWPSYQICSLTFFPSNSIVLILKSTPEEKTKQNSPIQFKHVSSVDLARQNTHTQIKMNVSLSKHAEDFMNMSRCYESTDRNSWEKRQCQLTLAHWQLWGSLVQPEMVHINPSGYFKTLVDCPPSRLEHTDAFQL